MIDPRSPDGADEGDDEAGAVVLEVEASGRLDAVLASGIPAQSRSRWAALIKDGCVRVDGSVERRPSARVEPGARIEAVLPEPVAVGVVAQDLPIAIVYQDADLVVIDKAPGMVVHPGAGHPDGTLVNALLHHVQDLSGIGGELRPGIVHRLDAGTSGLLVVAKHDRAHRHLAAQFADHSAGRVYLALCMGRPLGDMGRMATNLARHPKDRVRFASTDDPALGRRAVTHWRVVERFDGGAVLVRCTLETGRTHQVRVHCTEAGFPLLGDPLYGHARPPERVRTLVDPMRPLLHAASLHFVHPDGRSLTFHAPPPPDFQAVWDGLRTGS